MNQTALPFADRKLTHAEAAERWMAENPEAMSLFRRFAEDMRARGRCFGIGQLAERVRWECAIAMRGDDFKINNNHRAYIARRLVEDDPRLGELIELRAAGVERGYYPCK